LVGGDDNTIDATLKQELVKYEFGKLLEPKILGHIEYYYNTLNAAVQAQNPFDEP